MTIEFKCQRCGTPLRVPESKAGGKGRCPICGVRIKIPELAATSVAPHHQHSPSKVIWAVSAGVVLIIVICVVAALSKRHKSLTAEEGNGPELTSEQQAQLERPLAGISKLEDMVKRYRELRVEERRLRAREVLMKINSYEPVTGPEYALRGQVLEEQKEATQSAGDAGGENDPWKLNTPLEPTEKEQLERLSDELLAQSARLETELASVGIPVAPVKDSRGRALLDGAEVTAKLAARRESLVRDVRNGTP